MSRPTHSRPKLPFTASLILAAGAVACFYFFGCDTASASRTGALCADRQDDGWESADVGPGGRPLLPCRGSQPLPAALALGDANDIDLDSDEWKPAFFTGRSGGRSDEPIGHERRLVGASLPGLPPRSLQILFCSWLI